MSKQSIKLSSLTLVSSISKKEVIFGGPNYKQNWTTLTLFWGTCTLFNTNILKIPFNQTNSQTKLNEKKG